MRLAVAAAAVPVLWSSIAPSIALAEPNQITAGVSLGRVQDEAALDDTEASKTLGLWARLQLSPRVSGQVELQQLDVPFSSWKIRSASALLVVDLRDRGQLMPVMFAGAGLDRSVEEFRPPMTGYHIEGGFGLEYRSTGGLVLGIDGRLGGRSIDNEEQIFLDDFSDGLFAPGVREGSYRALRLTAGIRF